MVEHLSAIDALGLPYYGPVSKADLLCSLLAFYFSTRPTRLITKSKCNIQITETNNLQFLEKGKKSMRKQYYNEVL